MAYQFKVKLEGTSKPVVWRKLLVPETYTFYQLHLTIQAAFGWYNAHLFEFSDGFTEGINIGLPAEDDWDDIEKEDAQGVKLNSVFKQEKQKLHYIYDFGDDWMHLITLEKIIDERILQARCLDGKGACPPEDCGGIPGYYMLVEAVNDPENPDYEDMREWLGMEEEEAWDVNEFSLQEAHLRMMQYLQE